MLASDWPNRILWVAALLLLNGFFATAGVALASVRRSRLKDLAAGGQAGAKAALNLLANRERLFSVIQFGISASSLALGWAGQDLFFRLFAPLWHWPAAQAAGFAAALLAITYLHAVFGEVAPKNLAIGKADKLAVLVAPFLLVFSRVAGPFVFLIERSAFAAARILGHKGEPLGGGQAVETVKFLIGLSRRHGQLESFEERAIQRMLDLQDYFVREIMVPRSEMVSVPVETSPEEALARMTERHLSRLPVYQREPEQIVGVVHYLDLLAPWRERRTVGNDLRRLMRKPFVVPETKPLNQLIDAFRHERSHLAIVVDEHGTVVGLVTLEDVLEQIFGEIADEHDLRPPAAGPEVLELDGRATIRDLETQYGIELPVDAGFETLAGFLLYRLGYIPQPGDGVEYDGYRFTVLEMDRKRIVRVRIEKPG
jgi:putative hemolysin